MVVWILIKGATVLDGCGVPAYTADVRIAGSRIVEVWSSLAANDGERVFDAGGSYLTPEFIEGPIGRFQAGLRSLSWTTSACPVDRQV